MTPLSRRQFLGATGAAATAALLAACTRETKVSPLDWQPPPTAAPTPTLRGPEKLDGAAALARLADGNQRYTASQSVYPDQTAERRQALTQDQAPLAIVLTCADSCVPPEVLFDQGLGDLLVVRVAGNVLSDMLLGTVEYGVDHLNVPLVMVLGHARCGAVQSTMDVLKSGTAAPGHIASLVAALRPAVVEAQQQSGDVLDNAVRANIRLVLKQLRTQSTLLETKLGKQQLQVVGAYYDPDTGAVALLS